MHHNGTQIWCRLLTKISTKVNASDKLLNNHAMEKTANKAQKYLLDNNCGDLILNDHRTTKPDDRIYASDIMMMFLESERGQNVDTGESNCTIFDVSESLPSDDEIKLTRNGFDALEEAIKKANDNVR